MTKNNEGIGDETHISGAGNEEHSTQIHLTFP